jgi:hypothetical protein
VVFDVCLELLSGTLIFGIGNPNGISFTLFLVVHNFSFVDWALLKELQSPFCLLAYLLACCFSRLRLFRSSLFGVFGRVLGWWV